MRRHQMKTFSALLALCAGNSPVPGEFPAQRPVPRCFDVFFDLRLDKRLSKQSWGWWLETLSQPLWRHSNDEKSDTFTRVFTIYCTGFSELWRSIFITERVGIAREKLQEEKICIHSIQWHPCRKHPTENQASQRFEAYFTKNIFRSISKSCVCYDLNSMYFIAINFHKGANIRKAVF